MVPGLIQSWAAIRSVIASDEPYTTTGEPLPRFPDLLKDDKGGQAVRKRLAEADVNAFSGISGNPWKDVDEVLYYVNQPYIPATLRTELNGPPS